MDYARSGKTRQASTSSYSVRYMSKLGKCKKCGISFTDSLMFALMYRYANASGNAGYCNDETYEHDFEVLEK